mmetsp:Transcript_15466/g.34615  ORF Transcript_15466/g.34615 Transcript_15466/m.34615 type:complete len:438 (-) Transcript_15466:820-2133(-)
MCGRRCRGLSPCGLSVNGEDSDFAGEGSNPHPAPCPNWRRRAALSLACATSSDVPRDGRTLLLNEVTGLNAHGFTTYSHADTACVGVEFRDDRGLFAIELWATLQPSHAHRVADTKEEIMILLLAHGQSKTLGPKSVELLVEAAPGFGGGHQSTLGGPGKAHGEFAPRQLGKLAQRQVGEHLHGVDHAHTREGDDYFVLRRRPVPLRAKFVADRLLREQLDQERRLHRAVYVAGHLQHGYPSALCEPIEADLNHARHAALFEMHRARGSQVVRSDDLCFGARPAHEPDFVGAIGRFACQLHTRRFGDVERDVARHVEFFDRAVRQLERASYRVARRQDRLEIGDGAKMRVVGSAEESAQRTESRTSARFIYGPACSIHECCHQEGERAAAGGLLPCILDDARKQSICFRISVRSLSDKPLDRLEHKSQRLGGRFTEF